jgi:PAS domain S-box-containing protein
MRQKALDGLPFFAACKARRASGDPGKSPLQSPLSPRRFWGGLAAVFLALTAAIGLTGYFYARQQAARHMEMARNELSIIADLKAGQISNWYEDRLIDARTLLANPFAQKEIAQFLAEPSPSQAAQDLSEWFTVQAKLKHCQIFLYDAKGTMRLSAPADAPVPDASGHPDFQTALRANDMVVTDLHRDPGSKDSAARDIHLSFWIPEGIGAGTGGAAAGVLLLRINPYHLLFPLIQSWPTASPTGETLLVRRDGDEVVFLNELRHRKNTALALRCPLVPNTRLPAALAAQGQQGVVEGMDYRETAVLAALRGIPGTPWFMVAKVDLEEIYMPIRKQTVNTVLVLVALILAAALGTGLLGRRRDYHWLRQQLAVEHARQALAERYILLNKHANDIILLTDRDGRILEANDRALGAYGRPLEEMNQLTLRALCSEENRAEPERAAHGAAPHDGAMMEAEHRRSDGSPFPVEISTHAMEIGGVTYHQSIIRDITERKRAAQELRATRDYLEKLLDHANAPIIVWDQDLIITRFNRAFERLTGKTAEIVLGQHLSMLFPADTQETILAEVTRASAGKHWESLEIPIISSDGTVRTALWNSANVYAEDGKTLTATIAQGQDITERKQTALELARVNQELGRKNQELEQVVYVASHDLRSPLVNVQGFSAELKAALEELRVLLGDAALPKQARARLDVLLVEDLPESLGYILSGIAKMDSLIAGLLRLSRLGRSGLSFVQIDMNELLAAVARDFEFEVKAAGVVLSIDPLPPCLGDAAQLGQVFSNLLGNALKFLDPARPGVVRVTGTPENGQSVYCVEDNGIGMADRHQAKIFELYHRLNPGDSAGEGLGLTIVRTVLDRLHGRVWTESEPGVGSRFYVALPGAGNTGKDGAQ